MFRRTETQFSGFGRVGCRRVHALSVEWAGGGRWRGDCECYVVFHAGQSSRAGALSISFKSVRKDLELLNHRMIRSVGRDGEVDGETADDMTAADHDIRVT